MSRSSQHVVRGFTLIETMVYAAVFVLLASGAFAVMLSLQDLLVQYKAQQDLYTSATTLMERTLLSVRQADGVATAASTLQSTSSVLALVTDTGTSTWSIVDEQMVFTTPTTTSVVATPAVTVERFWVTAYETNGIDFVRIDLAVTTAASSSLPAYELRGGAVVRGSYGES